MRTTVLAVLIGSACFAASLTTDELKLLQDSGGWQYVTINDADSGIQTKHTCFDGKPHPDDCSGKLFLHNDDTFIQSVHIHGQQVDRHGKYEITDGDQIAFYDEFGTRDGPYTLQLDAANKGLTLDMPQVHVELVLDREYRKRMEDARKQNTAPTPQ